MLRKRWIALAGMSVAATSIVAWAATSYQVQTKLVNSGGTLKLREKAVQTSGLAYNNFTTSAAVPITVTAKDGYSIASITQTGQPTVYNPTSPWSGNFLKSGGTIQALGATFAVNKYSVTASATGDGTITPNPVPAVTYNTNVTLTATPKYTNSYIKGVTVSGSSYTTSALDGGRVAITLTGVKANSSVGVEFGTVSVSAGGNKVAAVNAPVIIYGSATGTGDLLWSVTGKPAGSAPVLTDETTARPTFTANATGKYTLTVTDSYGGKVLSTSSVQVDVVGSATDAMRTSCNGCHNPVSGAVPSMAYGQWSSSKHKASVNCVTCHTDGPMPTPVNTHTVDANSYKVNASVAGTVGNIYCAKCHAATVTKVQGSLHYTMAAAGKLVCNDCHAAGHNPVATSAACSTCHGTIDDHTAEATAGKTCIQCHDKHDPKVVTTALGPQPTHPAVTLYTFEEVGYQMNGGAPVPVQVDANGKGMPYSPKMTCGTSGCHVINGVNYTYDKISDHAFHSAQGRNEMQDTTDGKLDARKNKPWGQSTAMVGKW